MKTYFLIILSFLLVPSAIAMSLDEKMALQARCINVVLQQMRETSFTEELHLKTAFTCAGNEILLKQVEKAMVQIDLCHRLYGEHGSFYENKN